MGVVGSLFSSIGYGVLIALAVTGIIAFVLNVIKGRSSWSVIQAILTVVLFLLLAFQSSLIVASLYATSLVNGEVAAAAEMVTDAAGSVTENEILTSIVDKYPMLKSIVKSVAPDTAAEGSTGNAAITAMLDSVKSTISSFRWRRIAWSAGFVAVFIAAFFMLDGSGKSRNSRSHRESRLDHGSRADRRVRRSRYSD